MVVIVWLQANKPVIGIVQDTLAGIRLMTKRDTFIEKDVFMNMLVRCKTRYTNRRLHAQQAAAERLTVCADHADVA